MARFADTSYFLALLIPNDVYHNCALRLASEWTGDLMTTDFVLVEVANHLSPRLCRGVFSKLHGLISRDPRMSIVEATREWMDRGRALYDGRRDKDWSLTDCISFAAMQERGLREALTADHHFEQAGFLVLMK